MNKILSEQEIEKYQRHFAIDGFSGEHQEKIKNARIMIIGAGGLGSPLAIYLTAAGIGTIGIMDDDIVSLSNLQRQILYNPSELGEKKVRIAESKLKMLNPETELIVYEERLTKTNLNLLQGYDIIVDGSDNYQARYCIDEFCSKHKIPYVYGSIYEFTGQVSVFNTSSAGSYSDLYPNEFSDQNDNKMIGVMGFMPAFIASVQVGEVIKIITGLGEPLINKLLMVDLSKNLFKVISL